MDCHFKISGAIHTQFLSSSWIFGIYPKEITVLQIVSRKNVSSLHISPIAWNHPFRFELFFVSPFRLKAFKVVVCTLPPKILYRLMIYKLNLPLLDNFAYLLSVKKLYVDIVSGIFKKLKNLVWKEFLKEVYITTM